MPRQTANDRPDFMYRVFWLNFNIFLEDMTKKHVLGEVQVCVLTLPVVAVAPPARLIVAVGCLVLTAVSPSSDRSAGAHTGLHLRDRVPEAGAPTRSSS